MNRNLKVSPEENKSLDKNGKGAEEPVTNNEFERELLAAFKEFDEDGSGTISKEEFDNFMRKLGYHPTLVELQEMIDEVDKDKQGQIGFEEFKMIMTKTIRDEFTQNSSIEAFAVFDKAKSGKIKKENFINIFMTTGVPSNSSILIDSPFIKCINLLTSKIIALLRPTTVSKSAKSSLLMTSLSNFFILLNASNLGSNLVSTTVNFASNLASIASNLSSIASNLSTNLASIESSHLFIPLRAMMIGSVTIMAFLFISMVAPILTSIPTKFPDLG